MTDIERRAHDLALIFIQTENPISDEAMSQEAVKNKHEVFVREYLRAFHKFKYSLSDDSETE